MKSFRQVIKLDLAYEVIFTRKIFSPGNIHLVDILKQGSNDRLGRIYAVVDDGVSAGHPDIQQKIQAYFDRHRAVAELVAYPTVMAGGEQAKNDWDLVMQLLADIHRYKLDRQAYVLAIGGGAVLDTVGLAAALAHRGIRLIRVPTTVLAQSDSGVGVKTGVNFFGKKNFIGAFTPPFAVVNDADFLTSLTDRDWRSGMAEAVKVAVLKDPPFFQWLQQRAAALRARDLDSMETLVRRCACLHLDHIAQAGDPFETGSSRPLDFGHWAAHKLEQLSDFALRHGEAVAMGIALDVTYAGGIGLLPEKDADDIRELLRSLGFDLFHPGMTQRSATDSRYYELFEGLQEFREHLGGELTVILPEGIGKAVEVHEIDIWRMQQAIHQLQQCDSLASIHENRR